MIGLKQIIQYFSIRRLRVRASELAQLVFNNNTTVYPRQLHFYSDRKQRVLVFTPHADDETFGAGGTLALHIERGDDVHVVVFSDNVSSIIGNHYSNEDKKRIRYLEFANAMNILGISSFQMLELDQRIFLHAEKILHVHKILIENQPDVLYLPSLFDNHFDHRVINIWTARELAEKKLQNLCIRGFEVWSPLPATTVSDITHVFKKKSQAIQCYKTQVDAIDYEHHITGLNAYRAITIGRNARYAEAFLEFSSEQYASSVNKYLLTNSFYKSSQEDKVNADIA